MGAGLLLLGIAASRWLEDSDPSLALKIYPANVDARARLLAEGISSGKASELRVELDANARAMIALAPGNARGYSFLATLYAIEGDLKAAERYFAAALEVSPTDLVALTVQFRTAVVEDDPVAAGKAMNVLLRRYPKRLNEIAEYIPFFLVTPSRSAIFASFLRDNPPWRGDVVRELVKTEPGAAFVGGVLVDELRDGQPLNARERTMVINSQVSQGRPDQAYRFFLSTLGDEGRGRAGYVSDGRFEGIGSGSVFDWTVNAPNGVEVRAGPDAAGGAGLKVRFRDSPTRLGTVYQSLVLPPGTYRLVSEADAIQLVAPKDVYWRLTCRGGNRGERARLQFLPGRYRNRSFATEFTIPETGCPVQLLRLETGVRTDSLRIRYSGELRIRHIAIERLGA